MPSMEEATGLRMRMVALLKDAGVLATPSIEKAMRQVPRHLFVSQVDVHCAYLDEAVTVKHADDGSSMRRPLLRLTHRTPPPGATLRSRT